MGRDDRRGSGSAAELQEDRGRRHDDRSSGQAGNRSLPAGRGLHGLGQGRTAARQHHRRIRIQRRGGQVCHRGCQAPDRRRSARGAFGGRPARLSVQQQGFAPAAGAGVDQFAGQEISRHHSSCRRRDIRLGRRSMDQRRPVAICRQPDRGRAAAELSAARCHLQHRDAQQRAEQRDGRGDHADLACVRPAGARHQGRPACACLRKEWPRRERKFGPRSLRRRPRRRS